MEWQITNSQIANLSNGVEIPTKNHKCESTQWSGKSQIPQLPIHPMEWQITNSTIVNPPNGLEITKFPKSANVVNPME
jgi:hypothetical protein